VAPHDQAETRRPPRVADARASQVTTIEPSGGLSLPSLREVWTGRELLWFLVLRNIKVRYTQTVLGATWTLLQPLLPMVVFTVFFGRLADVPSDGLPYYLFSLSGLVVWAYFASTVTQGSQSLVSDAPLITKVYVPRVIIPLAMLLSGLLDLAITLMLLLGLLVAAGHAPPLTALLAVPFLVLTVLITFGAVLWLSALNVRFRDVRVAVPFLVQTLLFLTPIAYPASLVTGTWRIIYAVNPVVGAVEGFRWSVLGADTNPWALVVTSVIVTVILVFTGALYFRRLDRTFADVI